MAITYERKKQRKNTIISTIITAILICALFFTMVISFYTNAEDEAYEMLHIQTKQIKDDVILQIKSDKENLITMANFAAKLYASGQSYDLMFDSFKPIGLFSRIGILKPDGSFITKDETVNISEKLPFEQAVAEGEHITGRTFSYSRPDEEVVRCAVPIKVNDETVGIIYGIIKIEAINEKYNNMAEELDAQLFIYDKATGKFIVDSFNSKPGELSDFATREFNDGYSYEQLVNTDKGFTSFKSIRTGEDLYVHYSGIEDFGWEIMLARYETQVFETTHKISQQLTVIFGAIILIIAVYLEFLLRSEKNRTKLHLESSDIRHLLLEINQQHEKVTSALKRIKEFSGARSCFFTDTDGEDFFYIKPSLQNKLLTGEDRTYFHKEIFGYAAKIHNGKSRGSFLQILANSHLERTNNEFYQFMVSHGIKDISFAIVSDKKNHVSILGAINPRKSSTARTLISEVAVCFAIAVYNKKHLNKTELAATTDSLTGAMNRVAYKEDIITFNQEKPEDFTCIYIDVNELHIVNNKFGHAAGDEMLIYIANSLKEAFYGQNIYRMGGDEFLVFSQNTPQEKVESSIETFVKQLKPRGYHVAIGMSFRSQNANCEEMVREAEIRMYEAKAQYYQNKEQSFVAEDKEKKYTHIKTGIKEIDATISVLKDHYNGIYSVSLETDKAHGILMPSYLGYKENEENFSKLLTKYISDSVHPDFQRAVMNFLNYGAIKRHISDGNIPSITYKKANGETVMLSVYSLSDDKDDANETLWVFAKE